MPRVSFFRNDFPQDIDAMDQDNINRGKVYETNSKEKFCFNACDGAFEKLDWFFFWLKSTGKSLFQICGQTTQKLNQDLRKTSKACPTKKLKRSPESQIAKLRVCVKPQNILSRLAIVRSSPYGVTVLYCQGQVTREWSQ